MKVGVLDGAGTAVMMNIVGHEITLDVGVWLRERFHSKNALVLHV